MVRGRRRAKGGALVSAVIERVATTSEEVVDPRDTLAFLVVQLLRLAGGSVEAVALEPAALVLSREGLLDCTGVTYGCDYDLEIRSFDLRRGYVRALDAGSIVSDGRLISLSAAFD